MGANKKNQDNYYHDLYHELRAKGDKAPTLKEVRESKDPDSKTLLKLITRAAKELSEEEFCEYFENGEMPAIKLNKAEMQLLKGGGYGQRTEVIPGAGPRQRDGSYGPRTYNITDTTHSNGSVSSSYRPQLSFTERIMQSGN